MNKKGYTIIEVAAALAILAIMILPISSVFVSSIKYNILAREKLIMNNIARNYMEMAIYDENIQNEYLDNDYRVQIAFENYNDSYVYIDDDLYDFLEEVTITVTRDAREMVILKGLKGMR